AKIIAVTMDSTIADAPLGPVTLKARGWSAGERVVLVIRPTALHLSRVADETRVKVSVRSVSFLGETRRCTHEAGDLRLEADQPFAGAEGLDGEAWLQVLGDA